MSGLIPDSIVEVHDSDSDISEVDDWEEEHTGSDERVLDLRELDTIVFTIQCWTFLRFIKPGMRKLEIHSDDPAEALLELKRALHFDDGWRLLAVDGRVMYTVTLENVIETLDSPVSQLILTDIADLSHVHELFIAIQPD